MENNPVLLYYFSGTGNSKRIAELTAAQFVSAGFQAIIRNIERGLAKEHDGYAIHGFIAPVHGFGMPIIVAKFLRTLPRVANKRAFILASRGALSTGIPGYEGVMLFQEWWILRRKGYQIVGGQGIDMPANWTAIINPPAGDNAAAIYNEAAQTVRDFVTRVLGGDYRLRVAPPWPGPILGPLYYSLAVIAAPTYLLFSLFGHKFLGKAFNYDDNCNSCGLCERVCPAGAVKLVNGCPQWGWNCEQCMRCLNFCPQRAIHVPLLPIMAMIALAFVPINAGERVVGYIPTPLAHIPPWQSLIKFLADILAYTAVVIGIVTLHSAGQRSAPLRRLLNLSSATRLFRRYREPHFKVAELLKEK